MKRGLYRKLALMGMKKNKESYLPFSLASICIVALFYINLVLTRSEELKRFDGMGSLQAILGMGMIIIGFFSLIFLFYTNNFLMKRRRQEFALYNVLGMEKRHLSKVLLWENIYLAALTILAGLFFGAVFYKLVEGFLLRIIGLHMESGYFPTPLNLLITAALFLFFYGLIYLNSLWQLRKATPAELFRESRAGDRVPKVNWLIALLGALCLGGGYYLALSVPSPMQALQKFMIAVLLVMLGTYFGFMALSILVLKILQNKKSFYYKTKNFTAVSGLIYRMKQNALGLANICILSTAVLVVLSSATALHLGGEEIIRNAYPREVILTGNEFSREVIAEEKEKVDKALKELGLSAKDTLSFRHVSAMAKAGEEELFIPKGKVASFGSKDHILIFFVPFEDAKKFIDKPLTLESDEVAVFGVNEQLRGNLNYGDLHYKMKLFEEKPEFFKHTMDYLMKTYVVVVPSMEELEKIAKVDDQNAKKQNDSRYFYSFNLADQDGKEVTELEAHSQSLLQKVEAREGYRLQAKEVDRKSFRLVYGGIFFTGIFLGLTFILAAMLSIYYKQLTEGYEDRKRFGIMKKVGMTDKEVKVSIHRQILIVFFLPLVMAGVHIGFAFPSISKIMVLLNLTNKTLHLYSAIGVFLAFTLVYTLVYLWTSKTYYRIVSVKE